MSDYVRIDTVANEAIADLVRQRLEAVGIPCVTVPGDLSPVAGAGAAYTVTVPSECADQARAVLAD